MKTHEKMVSYEPKKKNRFTIKFKNQFEGIPQMSLKTANRPKYVNGEWALTEIVFRDAIGTSTSQGLMEGVHFYDNINRLDEMFITYDLLLLGPIGDTIEKWNIRGRIVSLDFGELSYDKDETVEIKMVIQPIKVILEF